MPGVKITLPCVAYTGDQPFAFISYAHMDAEGVYPEIQRLDLMGYRIWYDEGIDPGNEWPEEVASALRRCAAFIVFVTQRAIGSRNVRNEINYALKLSKPFFAIHLDETDLPPGMDLQMSSIQAILKWRMDEQSYVRNLERALPVSFGPASKKCSVGIGTDDDGLVELFARVLYSEAQNQKETADRTNWHQLDILLKQQVLAQSRSLLSMLYLAGFNVCRAAVQDGLLCFSEEDIDLLARMEHDSWSRERVEAGWRYGDKRDKDNKLSPYLLPWSEMPEEWRSWDRTVVRRLPELLLKSGYEIKSVYKHPESKTLFQLANSRVIKSPE